MAGMVPICDIGIGQRRIVDVLEACSGLIDHVRDYKAERDRVVGIGEAFQSLSRSTPLQIGGLSPPDSMWFVHGRQDIQRTAKG